MTSIFTHLLVAALAVIAGALLGTKAKNAVASSPIAQDIASVGAQTIVGQIGSGPDATEDAAIGAVASGATAALAGSSAGTPLAQSVPTLAAGALDVVAQSNLTQAQQAEAETAIAVGAEAADPALAQ